MKIALYTCIVSPHQLPFARAIKRLFQSVEFYYIYTTDLPTDAKSRGWSWMDVEDWIIKKSKDGKSIDILENCDVLISGERDIDLFERREKLKLKTFYFSERWFKPINVRLGSIRVCHITGLIRLLVPSYFKFAMRFIKWLNRDQNAAYLAAGPWARKDIALLGCLEHKIINWGYFVDPSDSRINTKNCSCRVRGSKILWIGRYLDWKRPDVAIMAVKLLQNKGIPVSLDLYGVGPYKSQLDKMVAGSENISIHNSIPIEAVRSVMQNHDIFVFTSDANEGWGVVVNEAVLEGMQVIGTYEAGASAAILPRENLYTAGDYRTLANIIEREIMEQPGVINIDNWLPENAAYRFMRIVNEEL